VHLRFFYLKKLISIKEKEKEEMDKSSGKSSPRSVAGPPSVKK
jgi:hypothetical protein